MHNYLRYADSNVKRTLSDLQNDLLHNARMDKLEPHERLRIARKLRYKTARAASDALGVPYGTYTGHESGSRGFFTEDAERYAKAFRVRAAWLTLEDGPMEVGRAQGSAPSPTVLPSDVGPITPLSDAVTHGGARDLPVHGIAMGGSEDEGDFRLNGEIQYFLDRPAGLKGRKRAFAAVLRNDSMIDSYKPGWPIFVDPDGKQPVAGLDDVFIELYPTEDGHPGPAFVKKLVSRLGREVVVWQQNPAGELRFPMDRVKQILRVIPYPEAMGLSV